jgi:hypothetical protein
MGRLFEPLLSAVPFLHTNGNHEIEPVPDSSGALQRMTSYNARYPVPTPDGSGARARRPRRGLGPALGGSGSGGEAPGAHQLHTPPHLPAPLA